MNTDYEKRNYVSYEAAKAIENVGYRENSENHYHNGIFTKGIPIIDVEDAYNSENWKPSKDVIVRAPSFPDAVEYFRINHKIAISVNFIFDLGLFDLSMAQYDLTGRVITETGIMGKSFPTIHEAYNYAIIKGCEIVKEGKK